MSTIAEIWTLNYYPADGAAAVEQTLAAWGIEQMTIERRDLQMGTCKFSMPVAVATKDGVFQHKSRIVINRAGVRFWEGRIVMPPVKIAAQQESLSYTAGDPFYYLTALPCHQAWRDHLFAEYEFARMIWFADWPGTTDGGGLPIGILKRPCGVEIAGLIDSVIADLARGGDGTLIGKGTIDDGMTPQPQKFGNATFFDALRTVSRFDTGRVSWWDYSGVGAPAFQSQLAGSLATVNVPFPLVRFTGGPHLEEQVPVVFLDVKVQNPFSLDAALPLLTTPVHYQYPNPYTGSLLGNIRLALDDTDFYTSLSLNSLCQKIWEQGQTIGWRGEVEIAEGDAIGSLAVGKLLNVTGGDPAWETMNSPIRAVTYDLARGRTVASFGPPARLSLADLMELMHPYYAKIGATKQEAREKSTGQSDEYNMGDGKGGAKSDPNFPPKGWSTVTGYIYNKASGKLEKYTFLVQGPGAVVSQDLALARAFSDSTGTPIMGQLAGIDFIPDP